MLLMLWYCLVDTYILIQCNILLYLVYLPAHMLLADSVAGWETNPIVWNAFNYFQVMVVICSEVIDSIHITVKYLHTL